MTITSSSPRRRGPSVFCRATLDSRLRGNDGIFFLRWISVRALLHQLPDALCNSRAHNGDAAGVRRASDHALCTGLPMTMSVEVATDCPTRDRLLSEFSIPTEGRFDSPLLHLALPRSLTAVIALKENVMSRQHYARCKQVVVAATLALGAISSALADDSSMNPFA